MSAWTGKPCARCGGRKGPKYDTRKHCGRCVVAERKEAADRAHRRRIAKTYGIEPEDYERMYIAQGGRCAICQRATGKTRRLSVDHDHKTGEVRGLLCRPCNDMLGHCRDDRLMILRAATYLYEPPARSVLRGPTCDTP